MTSVYGSSLVYIDLILFFFVFQINKLLEIFSSIRALEMHMSVGRLKLLYTWLLNRRPYFTSLGHQYKIGIGMFQYVFPKLYSSRTTLIWILIKIQNITKLQTFLKMGL